MKIKSEYFLRILAVAALVAALQGCDQIKTLVDYFSPPHKKTASSMPAPVPQSSSAAVSSTQSTKATGPMAPDELVRVGNWSMTIGEFNDRLQAIKQAVPGYDTSNVAQNKQILEELIRQELLVQAAEHAGLGKNKEVAAAIQEFRKTVLVRAMAARVVKDVKVTPEEAQQYYNQHKEQFTTPTQYKIEEIVMPDEAGAKRILAQIYQGGDFAAFMPGSAKHAALPKGQNGYLTLREMPFQKMAEVVQPLDAGAVSGAFKGPEGYYIVKVMDKKEGQLVAYDKIKKEVQVGLTQMKQQKALLNYVDALQKKASVEVNEKLLGQTPPGRTGESGK